MSSIKYLDIPPAVSDASQLCQRRQNLKTKLTRTRAKKRREPLVAQITELTAQIKEAVHDITVSLEHYKSEGYNMGILNGIELTLHRLIHEEIIQ